jgi:hypothetical protein
MPMPEGDQTPDDAGNDSADTASFQQFVDASDTTPATDNRTFRLLSLLVAVVVLIAGVYLLLQ